MADPEDYELEKGYEWRVYVKDKVDPDWQSYEAISHNANKVLQMYTDQDLVVDTGSPDHISGTVFLDPPAGVGRGWLNREADPILKRARSIVGPDPGEFQKLLEALVEQHAASPRPPVRPRATEIFVVGGIPIGVTFAGILLIIGAGADPPIQPNPFVALFVFLAGLGLLATAALALRRPAAR